MLQHDFMARWCASQVLDDSSSQVELLAATKTNGTVNDIIQRCVAAVRTMRVHCPRSTCAKTLPALVAEHVLCSNLLDQLQTGRIGNTLLLSLHLSINCGSNPFLPQAFSAGSIR